MQTKTQKPFNKRAFTSVAMLISGLILPFSGFMNHELQFEPLSIQRHFWMTMHNTSAILFVIFAIIHITFNWRALFAYVKQKGAIFIKKEGILAAIVVILVVSLLSSHVFHVH
jgi:hypothetical protein